MHKHLTVIIAAILLISLGGAALAKPASGKNKSSSEISDILANRKLDTAKRFVISNTLFTIYHEVGHLLINKQQWPVLGREEDIADNFATYILLNQKRRSIERALKDAALGWQLEDEAGGSRRTASDYYDEHSLDLQRAYQIVCMMVGKDRRSFSVTALEWGIDRRRQAGCADQYKQISSSIEKLISANRNKDTQPEVKVIYERAGTKYAIAYKTLRDSRLLESVAADLRTGYGLTGTIKIVASLCNQPNAFYDNETSQIIICYELLDEYFNTINRYLASTNGK
ncbi:hypothetical protein MNBD_ALPHA12-2246 [hydrothermal vent metagenome]|uniref:Uncharacterized protein n=1 Tax=hydrothermal vent metagenome TaxID=652676 RepID=A0A3B0U7P8_9ZZZZ